MNVLILCTANQCRSPMAEGILRVRTAELGLPVTVSSAGAFPGGSPATPDAVLTLRALGIDIDNHVSRRLDRSMVANADLVLTMTREHLREAVVTDPSAFGRIFTLKEFVRKLKENPTASLAELHQGRSTRDYLHNEPDDDVPDPIGKSRSVYEATARDLDVMLRLVAMRLPTLGIPDRSAEAS